MNEAKTPEPQLKPVAVFLDRGKVITLEFIPRSVLERLTDTVCYAA
jgi:hypothetical protein